MLQAYVRRICEFLLVCYLPFFIWAAHFSATTQCTLGEQWGLLHYYCEAVRFL